MSNKLAISWELIVREANILSETIKAAYAYKEFAGILAVTKGGLVPAALLATRLDIKHVDTVCISSYCEGERNDVQLHKPITNNIGKWLIVDDLVDSGETFKYLRSRYPESVFVTLFAKPKGVDQVDHYSKLYSQDVWIDFPWE